MQIINAALRKVGLELHTSNVHQTYIARQAQFAGDAVEAEIVRVEGARMAPVKKKRGERGKHYLRNWRMYLKKNGARDMTLEKVAALIEVDHTSLSRVERGETPYDEDLLSKLSLVYGCLVESWLERMFL
jgi:ribosome-binding protein aMBF1 (putative translation factor)